jgi:hypothetical protein
MKQTAVEWLYNNLKSHFEYDGDLLEVVQFSFEYAKQIEKQQIVDSFCRGDDSDCISEQNSKDFAEQYYNETFNSQLTKMFEKNPEKLTKL